MNKSGRKIRDLREVIHLSLETGNYLDTTHAYERQRERGITRLEILQVLRKGCHEARKDRFDPHFRTWNYAIRGRTVDGRDLRIIVTFQNGTLVMVTVMEIANR